MTNAAILVGGQARRFGGVDKSALAVDGRSILDRQLTMLADVERIREVMLVGGATVRPQGRMIPDRVPGSGPLGGIHAALATTIEEGGDAVFVLACDMPYVTADLINHLLDRSADADVVVPHTDRGYHPLCAVYGRACLGPIEQHLAERRLKITHLFSDVRTHAIDANELSRFGEPRRLLSNVNTPHDHAALHASQDHEL